MKRATLTLLVLLTAGTPAAFAGAELVLEDGQVLQGVDVRREGDEYLLELESGRVLSIPVELVRGVRLTGEQQGLTYAEPEQLAGTPPDKDAPSGLREAEPQQLAGPPGAGRPPTTSEALEALGEPSRFSNDIINPRWEPDDAWSSSPAQNEGFAPSSSTWSRSVVDPEWAPKSSYDANVDVLKSGRAQWQDSIIDPNWQPEDAWEKQASSRGTS